MSLKLTLAAGALLASAGVLQADATDRTSSKSCMDTAITQGEMNGCAASLARAADMRLNTAYREVICHYTDDDSKDEKAQLIASQRAWIAFRDADCHWQISGGGTISPMNYSLCIANLSNARAEELNNWPFITPRDAIGPCEAKK